ncbi:MAG: glycyl-radical enzyme activating protein [Armatimonadota bacterium]
MSIECEKIEANSECGQTEGLIFDIQRFSIHDGPGIRTTVFLKGCPLNCAWCHNPESQYNKPEIAFYSHKCIGCGRCFKSCVNGGIIPGDEHIDRAKCVVCGACAKLCPPEALRLIGRVAPVDEVVGVVMRDQPFYKTSGGGATISGGEPLFQYEFSRCLLRALKENGLHTAIETCGLASWEKVSGLAEFTDLFLYDIKVIDAAKHKSLCGVDNALIMQNARRLAETGKEILIRTPIIPGCNDSPDDIRALGEFVLSLSGQRKLELMPYHKIGSGKYEALGRTYRLPDVEAPESMDGYKGILIDIGVELVQA